jgi:hypothetical protein
MNAGTVTMSLPPGEPGVSIFFEQGEVWGGHWSWKLDISDMFDYERFFAGDVQETYRDGRRLRRGGKLVEAAHLALFALWGVGERRPQHDAVVGRVDGDAVDHGTPVDSFLGDACTRQNDRRRRDYNSYFSRFPWNSGNRDLGGRE